MSDFFLQYGLFLAKAVTFVAVILAIVSIIGAAVARRRDSRDSRDGRIQVHSLNEKLENMQQELEDAVLDEAALKQLNKQQHKKEKAEAKARRKAAKKGEEESAKRRVFVVDFDGDIQASQVEKLREEITAILTLVKPQDEVVLRLESPGGMVHGYGLAASQLERVRRQNIPLTICVDRVAASGGYMMACIGSKILAAPFALLGSIGVVAQLPNFHRLLKKHDVDYEVYTAGEYKRTLTMFGENTEKGREKFIEELEDTHDLFKHFVSDYRPTLEVERVATGEAWFGRRALEQGLIDDIKTSDDYLFEACKDADVYSVSYETRRTLQDRLNGFSSSLADHLVNRVLQKLQESRFWSK